MTCGERPFGAAVAADVERRRTGDGDRPAFPLTYTIQRAGLLVRSGWSDHARPAASWSGTMQSPRESRRCVRPRKRPRRDPGSASLGARLPGLLSAAHQRLGGGGPSTMVPRMGFVRCSVTLSSTAGAEDRCDLVRRPGFAPRRARRKARLARVGGLPEDGAGGTVGGPSCANSAHRPDGAGSPAAQTRLPFIARLPSLRRAAAPGSRLRQSVTKGAAFPAPMSVAAAAVGSSDVIPPGVITAVGGTHSRSCSTLRARRPRPVRCASSRTSSRPPSSFRTVKRPALLPSGVTAQSHLGECLGRACTPTETVGGSRQLPTSSAVSRLTVGGPGSSAVTSGFRKSRKHAASSLRVRTPSFA